MKSSKNQVFPIVCFNAGNSFCQHSPIEHISNFMKKYVEYQYKNQIKDWDWEYAQHPIANLSEKLEPHMEYIKSSVANKTLVPEFIPVFGEKEWVKKVSSSTNGEVTEEEFNEWMNEYPDIINGHGHKFLRNFGSHRDQIVDILSQELGLDKETMVVRVQIEEPGHFYPVHLDRYNLQTTHADQEYNKEEDNKRNKIYIVMFNDWVRGQMLQLGDNFVKWKAGDVIAFNLRNVPHCTCNVGYEPNFMFIITTPTLYK